MKSFQARRTAIGAFVLLSSFGLAGGLAAGSNAPSPGRPPQGHQQLDAPGVRSWLVRLEGSTLWEEHRAERRLAAAPPAGVLESRRRAIADRQAPVARLAADLGADVVDGYQVAYNGLLVHADAEQADKLAQAPGVRAVVPAPILHLDLKHVARTIGADRARADLGLDGAGTAVAVVDTGIDYTHAMFGGAGTVAAYEANEENRVETGSFPTAKVTGGYDFAGWRYSAACPVAGGNDCWRQPKPDGDPLDPSGLGHGTHVAGIVAGQVTPRLAPGVAPGARLVALKIFGNPVGAQATTDLAVGAIEWVMRHNMGLAVPGAAPDGPIDVINMSLGSDWSSEMGSIKDIVDAAVESGVTVVASAGNGGALPYIVNSPGTADLALSVASSIPAGQSDLHVSATWSGGGRIEKLDLDALEGSTDWLPSLLDAGVVRSTLAWYGLACDAADGQPSKPVQDVDRRIALVERGDCSFYEKVANAERLGAVGVVVFTDGFQKSTMACDAPSPCDRRPAIPAVMIDREPGIALRDLVQAGVAVNMTLARYEKTFLTDTVSPFSSRGPARQDAAIKPQITAPGSGVTSALAGSGDKGFALSGTSMAGPAVAGAAALIWQRSRRDDLGLDAADVGALLMNYADPVVHVDRQDTGPLAPVMRQGAGRLNAWRSATGRTLVRTPHGLAALGFGHVWVADTPVVLTDTLLVRNLTGAPQIYAASAQLAFPDEDRGRGVDFHFEPDLLALEVGQEGAIGVKVEVRPEALRLWNLRGAEPVRNERALQALEIDGSVVVEAVDNRGRPIAGGDRVGVPFHVLPRRHPCVGALTLDPFLFYEEGEAVPQVWANGCGAPGDVEAYALAGEDPAESERVNGFPARVDIDAVGVRVGPVRRGDEDDGPVSVSWLIHLRGPHRLPGELEARVYLDLDRDGTFDRVVFNAYGPTLDVQAPAGQWWVAHAPLLPGTLEPDLDQLDPQGTVQAYDLDESTIVLTIVAEDVGVKVKDGPKALQFAVSVGDAMGDFPAQPGYPGRDFAPDGLRRGTAFVLEEAALTCVELADPLGRLLGRAGEALRVPGHSPAVPAVVRAACDPSDMPREFGLLFHYPANAPDRQIEVRRGKIAESPPTATRAQGPPTASPSPGPATRTPSPTRTPTRTPSPTRTTRPSSTPTASATSKLTPRATPTTTASPAPKTPTRTPTPRPDTPAPSATRTPVPSATRTPVPPTPTPSIAPDTATPEPTSPATMRPPSDTPVPTRPSPTASRTPLPPTASPTATAEPPASDTPVPTIDTPVPTTDTPDPSPTARPSDPIATARPSSTTPRETDTPAPTDTPTATRPLPSRTPSASPTRSPSRTPTATASLTVTREPTSTPPAALPNLTVREMSVSQAVQAPFDGAPLVAGRPVVVRVMVGVGWGDRPVPGVTGRLYAARGGRGIVGAPLSPINPEGRMTAPAAPNPLRMDDTLNFVLPMDWTQAGSLTLWVDLNPDLSVVEYDYTDNRSADHVAIFRDVPPLEVVLVPVHVQPGGVGAVQQPRLDGAAHFGLGMLERLYPLAQVGLRLHTPYAFRGAMNAAGQRAILGAVAQLRLQEHPETAWLAGADGGAGLEGPPGPVYYAVLPPEAGLADVLAYSGGGVAIGPVDRPEAAARAIGLALGLGRVACRADDTAGVDPAYPHAGGMAGTIGLDVFRLAPVPATNFDLMAACAPVWVSDYHYNRLFQRLISGQPAGAAASAADRAEASGVDAADQAAGTGWLLSGTITAEGRGAAFNPLEVVAAVPPVAAAGEQAGAGRFRLELRDAAGRILFAYAFDPIPMVAGGGAGGGAGFGMIVPRTDGAAEAVLAGGGRDLARLRLAGTGAQSPALDMVVLPPSSRDPNRLSVVWEVEGAPGTTPSATLRYSRDGGQTWRTLVAATREARIDVALDQLAGSDKGYLELAATAGTTMLTRRVSVGAIPNRAPKVGILGDAVIRRDAGAALVLAGEAVDLEDGPLPDASLAWAIPSTGLKATGRTLVLGAGLPAGFHTITLTATDSAGARQTARVTVAVGLKGRAYLPWVATRR